MAEKKTELAPVDLDKLVNAFWGGDVVAGEKLRKADLDLFRSTTGRMGLFKTTLANLRGTYLGMLSDERKPVMEIVVNQNIADLRKSLDPKTALESLLAERIVICYLESNTLDTLVATIRKWDGMEIYLKRQNAAHKRYLTAVKALAQVRRLQLPMVQVNIGENQVNAAKVSLKK